MCTRTRRSVARPCPQRSACKCGSPARHPTRSNYRQPPTEAEQQPGRRCLAREPPRVPPRQARPGRPTLASPVRPCLSPLLSPTVLVGTQTCHVTTTFRASVRPDSDTLRSATLHAPVERLRNRGRCRCVWGSLERGGAQGSRRPCASSGELMRLEGSFSHNSRRMMTR